MVQNPVTTSLEAVDETRLAEAIKPIAARYRRANNLIMKGLNKLSLKLESATEFAPESVRRVFEGALKLAVERVYDVAAKTSADPNRKDQRNTTYVRIRDRIRPYGIGARKVEPKKSETEKEDRLAGIASAVGLNKSLAVILGSASGFFGPVALIPELPITVGLIFREIRGVAVTYGFDPNSEETRKHCLAIFGSGTILEGDDAADLGFIASRYFVHGTTVREMISRFIPRIAGVLGPRFLSPPVIGAAVGAGLNGMYINYFAEVGHVYFQLLELEDEGHDPENIREEFLRQVHR